MVLLDPKLTASHVLRVFHHDEIFLFLGSAFTTVGLVILAFLVIRRRFDAMLFWLALFAIFYGQRLWMRSELLAMTIPPSEFFERLKAIVNYLVAIPAFFFFRATGFLGRFGKYVTYLSIAILCCVIIAAAFGAPLRNELSLCGFAIVNGPKWRFVTRF